MTDSKIDIGSYSEYEGKQSPRVFFAHGEKITVVNVRKMWLEEQGEDGKQRRFYVVQGTDGFDHTLYHDLETGAWFYRGYEKPKHR